MLLLAGVCYSKQSCLLGAAYIWVYANRHGSRVEQAAPGEAPLVPTRSVEQLR